jgi:hypothetical protein
VRTTATAAPIIESLDAAAALPARGETAATHESRHHAARVPHLRLPAIRPAVLAYRDGRGGTGGGAWLLWGCGLLAAALTVRRSTRRCT